MMKVPWFVPLPPWIGGDLQTLRNFMRPPGDILAPWPGETDMQWTVETAERKDAHGSSRLSSRLLDALMSTMR